jgi:hypothetical protein
MRLVVDSAFVLDAYLSGRRVLLARNEGFCFNVRGMPYECMIVGPVVRQHEIAAALKARLVRAYGDPGDEFACYAELYVPAVLRGRGESP